MEDRYFESRINELQPLLTDLAAQDLAKWGSWGTHNGLLRHSILTFVRQLRLPQPNTAFDLTGDGAVNQADRDELIVRILDTTFGDANLDRIFDSSDIVHVFQSGRYEDDAPLNAGWEQGDWDGDGEFGTSDLILAFQAGGYEANGQNSVGARKGAQSLWHSARS